ncbi:MAG: PDZ domain-containing protein [Planctomycetota bacterium]|nr:PDZ domain-containing protein [Planctomycetota bacterium]
MRAIFLRMTAVGGLLAAATVLAAEPSSAAPAKSPATFTREQIDQWVKDLNSDRFVERELATEKLIGAGAAAVLPLAEALQSNNLEVTTRGVIILQELALAAEPEAESAARTTLQKLAETRFTSAARRAAEALTKLDALRAERALAELKRLGALVGNDPVEFGFQVADRYALVFGDKWRGEEQDLARLRHLHDVGELIFEGPQVTDGWLKYVPEVHGIGSLTVKHASITDTGVKHLKNLCNVQMLSLMYVPIGDPAIDVLTQLQGLGTLRIFGTNVSRPAAEKLQQALLRTKVDVRFGGFLGIGCQPALEGCVIYTVRPNSAAEKGGLLANDVLYEYEGQKVNDFEMLTALISKNKAGDTVTLKLIRGDERLVKKVTLGEWE